MRRVWAVVPAAGYSRRMGCSKLLLDVAGLPVIHHVVTALQAGGVDAVHVLVREGDLPLRDALRATAATVHSVAQPTVDMRASVEHLLRQIEVCADPRPTDAWLLVPADHPVLSATMIRSVLAAAASQPRSIVIPTHAGRRGHPTLFPWTFAAEVRKIPADRGLNWLLTQPAVPVMELPVGDPAVLFDLDTPADYQRLLDRPGS